jgi:hypothetical protein
MNGDHGAGGFDLFNDETPWILWSNERELLLENGHLKIPRFRLNSARNDRYNSFQMEELCRNYIHISVVEGMEVEEVDMEVSHLHGQTRGSCCWRMDTSKFLDSASILLGMIDTIRQGVSSSGKEGED